MRHAPPATDRRSLIALGGFLVVCFLVAGLAGAVTNPKIPTWYAGLEKPAAQRDVREALGRSRGGYGTKACVLADGAGRAIAFALAPGQAHELPMASGLLDCLPDASGWVVGDRGLSSHDFRERIWDSGVKLL